MKKIVLIPCVSKKLEKKAKASELYISPLFNLTFAYAKSLNPDKILILSAKHGLLKLDEEIEPYNETLNNKPIAERKEWSKKVLEDLREEADLEEDDFIFLTGKNYHEFLIEKIKRYSMPLKGLGIGRRLKFLKENRRGDNLCGSLHQIFWKMKRFRFPFDESKIPLKGIYILFERGEEGHGGERIVRVGTHTGEGQLPSRLKQHFLNENKDRSIFRKNIGRAFLNKENDKFIDSWEIDLTTREAKDQFSKQIDLDKQKKIEKDVTKYIQDNFSFVVFPIEDKDKRLEFESKIISTISGCTLCFPSKSWLGLSSPKEKIKDSGLWLVNELYKKPLSKEDFIELERLIKSQNGDTL